MTRFHPLRRAFIAVVICSGLAACSQSEQNPTASLKPEASADRGPTFSNSNAQDPRTASQRPAATAASGSYVLARCWDRVPASYSAKFGPSGGVLEFGDSRLIIPGGALKDTVTITATVMDATTSRVELQPHGLQFAKPAGLQLGTQNCILSNEGYPAIVYLSPTGEVLETIPAVYDPHWHTVASPINHFSGYAMGF
jgi:hypothetical protein